MTADKNTRREKNYEESKGIVVLLLTLILTVFFCFTAAVGIGPTGTGAAKHINTGLDLAGGVSITYQAKESNPTSEEMSDTIYKLQKRVEQYSTEAQVYQEGSDRITVEIPGVTDADTILNDLGKPGSLYFITKEMLTETRTLLQDRMDMFSPELWMRSRNPEVLFWKVLM